MQSGAGEDGRDGPPRAKEGAPRCWKLSGDGELSWAPLTIRL